MKIKTGDKVKVIAGKDKGKTGTVLQVFPELQRVSVEGINLLTKHLKKRSETQPGQKIQFPAPLHISNIMVIDPKTGQPTRIGHSYVKKGEKQVKVRIARKSKESLT